VALSRIGILGGSFDPPHLAHVALAKLLCAALSLDTLRIIPAGQPWQKHHLQASSEDRLAMLRLAFAQMPMEVAIDTRELGRAGPSYSADTLAELRAELGADACLVFLMGADQLLGLPSWHAFPEILDLANFAVAGRPGVDLDQARWPVALTENVWPRLVAAQDLVRPAGQVVLVPADLGDLSSSQVRELLRQAKHQKLSHLLPSAVLDYIRQRGLYLS
jgi:nicotinate-nucleotide adenylyltransferase